MHRFFPATLQALRYSILWRAAIAMGFLGLLSLASIVISASIADDISGRANAVNMSGSLRFLSYRILSEVQAMESRSQASATIALFEHRLFNLDHIVSTKSKPDSASASELRRVLQRWNTPMRALALQAQAGDARALHQLASEVPLFVDQIDAVVSLIEQELEQRARWLRVVQLVLLASMVVTSVCTLWMLQRQLLHPLAQLLKAAQTVRQGSFSARVHHVGQDELGRLGQAFNTMVAEIANMYTHLEDKVEEKTQALQHSNNALELLYRVSQRLAAPDLTLPQVQEVLAEVEQSLGLNHSMLCIREDVRAPAHSLVTGELHAAQQALCSKKDCDQCFARAALPLMQQNATSPLLTVAIGDGDRVRAVMPIVHTSDSPLSEDKVRIIETVGHHVSNALINMRRAEEKHRLAVMEERSAIARELHDSIAQSLSYLKIQVTRLERSLEQGLDAHPIAAELRVGLTQAYSELRELIVTFRLRIDERGLGLALQDTVAEYSAKLGFAVVLHNQLSGIVLSANEELHVLRIVREALSNIERHAHAQHAQVRLSTDAYQSVTVRIEDDGCGFDPHSVPANHFGVNIMHDRTHILAGRLDVVTSPGHGCAITLQFVPQKVRQSANPPPPHHE